MFLSTDVVNEHHLHDQYTTFTAVPGGLLIETAVITGSNHRPAAASVFVPCDDAAAAKFIGEVEAAAKAEAA